MADERIAFKCIEVTQPIGTFYVGVLDAKDLVDISWADVQRIERREVEEFLGIERPLSKDRVAELQKYVRTVDATFPTGIIIAVSSEDADYDQDSGTMTIAKADKVAKIIDGQHRIAGLTGYANGAFQVNVTVFVDMDLEDQAMVFATINMKQTRVSKSLAYNLYEYATSPSPQKTCHDIAKLLNKREGSPFQDKIKILGRATAGKLGETLTQAAFVEQVLKLISDDPDADRDLLKRGKSPKPATPEQARRLILRDIFLDRRDADIALCLWDYFLAVRRRWPQAWDSTERGVILSRTTGFVAFMRLLACIYSDLGLPARSVGEDAFHGVLSRARIEDGDFNAERYRPGSAGQAALFRELLEQTGVTCV